MLSVSIKKAVNGIICDVRSASAMALVRLCMACNQVTGHVAGLLLAVHVDGVGSNLKWCLKVMIGEWTHGGGSLLEM